MALLVPCNFCRRRFHAPMLPFSWGVFSEPFNVSRVSDTAWILPLSTVLQTHVACKSFCARHQAPSPPFPKPPPKHTCFALNRTCALTHTHSRTLAFTGGSQKRHACANLNTRLHYPPFFLMFPHMLSMGLHGSPSPRGLQCMRAYAYEYASPSAREC